MSDLSTFLDGLLNCDRELSNYRRLAYAEMDRTDLQQLSKEQFSNYRVV
jgi:hypothetical protein